MSRTTVAPAAPFHPWERAAQSQTAKEHKAAREEAAQQGRNFQLGPGASRDNATVYAAQAANMTKMFGNMSISRGGKRRAIKRKQRKTRKSRR